MEILGWSIMLSTCCIVWSFKSTKSYAYNALKKMEGSLIDFNRINIEDEEYYCHTLSGIDSSKIHCILEVNEYHVKC
ncbi:MAG: hypothetical protein HEQ32_01865 [Vampirovibrio sp.]